MKKTLFNYQVNLNTGKTELYVGEVDLQYKHCKTTKKVSGSIYANSIEKATDKLNKKITNLLKINLYEKV
jgi:hypothetical protein